MTLVIFVINVSFCNSFFWHCRLQNMDFFKKLVSQISGNSSNCRPRNAQLVYHLVVDDLFVCQSLVKKRVNRCLYSSTLVVRTDHVCWYGSFYIILYHKIM